MKEKIKLEWRKLIEGADKKAIITILYMTVAIGLYFYFGIQDFFVKTFGAQFANAVDLQYYKYIYHNFMAFLFFFVLSIPVVKLLLKQKAEDVGLVFKEKKMSIAIMLIALLIVPIMSLSAAIDPEMAAMYPLGGAKIFSGAGFFILYYVSYMAYYFGWEYLFRGMSLNIIGNKYGFALAIAITTMISSLIHSSIAGFGKPFAETFSAIFGGILLGFIAYKSKSIYPTFVIHLLLGFSLDMLIRIL
ncbi:MAG: CPBP family intramembrane metalloprotease [Clostridia bacterium]|nr:CPBP family intramembrane metalloprotease [Clostridia bacterium]